MDIIKLPRRLFGCFVIEISNLFFYLHNIGIKNSSKKDMIWELLLRAKNPDSIISKFLLLKLVNNIKYTPDREYCRTSISYYKSTCPSPTQQLNNFDSLLWLAWCHSELMITGIPLSVTIPADATVQSIRYIIEPLITLQFVELTKTITAQEPT